MHHLHPSIICFHPDQDVGKGAMFCDGMEVNVLDILGRLLLIYVFVVDTELGPKIKRMRTVSGIVS